MSSQLHLLFLSHFSHLHFYLVCCVSPYLLSCHPHPFFCIHFFLHFCFIIIWFYLVWVLVGLELCPFQVDSSPSPFGKSPVGTASLAVEVEMPPLMASWPPQTGPQTFFVPVLHDLFSEKHTQSSLAFCIFLLTTNKLHIILHMNLF